MYKKTLTASLAVFAAIAIAACGGGSDAPAAGGGTPAPAPGAVDPASITDGGTISGSINFGGDSPEPPVLQMAADPFCASLLHVREGKLLFHFFLTLTNNTSLIMHSEVFLLPERFTFKIRNHRILESGPAK